MRVTRATAGLALAACATLVACGEPAPPPALTPLGEPSAALAAPPVIPLPASFTYLDDAWSPDARGGWPCNHFGPTASGARGQETSTQQDTTGEQHKIEGRERCYVGSF